MRWVSVTSVGFSTATQVYNRPRRCEKPDITSLRGGETDEAIQLQQLMDCFAALAKTNTEFSHSPDLQRAALVGQSIKLC